MPFGPFSKSAVLAGLACAALISNRLHASDGLVDVLLDPTTSTIIDQPGSYILVQGETINSGVTALAINAADVALDLNGMTINGGATALSINGDNVTIRRGTIRGTSGPAIAAASAGAANSVTIEDVSVFDAGGAAIDLGDYAELRRVLVQGGGSAGTVAVDLGKASRIQDGRFLDLFASRTDSTPGVTALRVGQGSRIEGNLIGESDITSPLTAIESGEGAVVANNTLSTLKATGNMIGIRAGSNAVLENNLIRDLTGSTSAYGIQLDGSHTHVRSNVLHDIEGVANVTYAIYSPSATKGLVIERNTISDFSFQAKNPRAVALVDPQNCRIAGNTVDASPLLSNTNSITVAGDSASRVYLSGNIVFRGGIIFEKGSALVQPASGDGDPINRSIP